MTVVKRAIALFLGIVLFMALFEAFRPPAALVFVVPKDYRGVIKVVLDESEGTDIQTGGRTATIVIPDGGKLVVNSFAPFRRWSTVNVRDASGRSIAFERFAGDISDDAVAFRMLGEHSGTANAKPTMVMLIGTDSEAQAYNTNPR